MKNPINKTAKPLGILGKQGFRDFGGSVTYEFLGDLDTARSHTGIGQSLVKTVADLMRFADVQALQMSKNLYDGTKVSAAVVMNHAHVTITSPQVVAGKERPIKERVELPEWIKIRDIWCTGGDRGYFFGGGDFGNGIYEIALMLPKFRQGFTDFVLNSTLAAQAGEYPAGTKSLFTCQAATPRGDMNQLISTPGHAESVYIASFPHGDYDASRGIYNSAAAFVSMPSRVTAGILLRQQINRFNPVETGGYHTCPGRDWTMGIGLSFIADYYEWASDYAGQVLGYQGNGEPNFLPCNDIHVIQQDVVAYRFGGDAQFPVPDESDIIHGAWQMTWAEPKLKAVRFGYDGGTDNALISVMLDATNEGLLYSNLPDYDWEIGKHDLLSVSKRLYATLVGYVSKSVLDHSDGGSDYYKSTGSVKVRVAQIEDDGTMNAVSLDIVPSQLFGPSNNTYCYPVPSGETEFTYLPCSYDVVCAPKNTVLVCKDRQSSILATGGATGAAAMDCVAVLTRLLTGDSWSVVPTTDVKANVAVWAKDGSAFISRRWISQKFAPTDYLVEGEWTFRLDQKEGGVDPEAYSYDLYLFNGETFVNALTIRPNTYPPTSWANINHYCFYHSDNMETLVIVGSSNADGIYTKNPDGTLNTLYTGQDGFEPIFISPDGRCVATNTMIFLDGEQVAAPTRCAGVFFDYGAFMDYDPGTETEQGIGITIKSMAANVAASSEPGYAFELQPDCPVIAALGPQYNFWELSPDSSCAVCSRFYRDPEEEDTSEVMMRIVDFANGPYKFETTDQMVVHHFPPEGTDPVESGTDFYIFPDIYGKSDEDGIPYGARYWSIGAINDTPAYALFYIVPEWGFNANWFYEYDQWHGTITYRVQDSAVGTDTNNAWYLGSEEYHHRAFIGWPTGQHTGPAVGHTYSDAYFRRKEDSNYLDKRIYSHIFYHKVGGILERIWDQLGEIPDEIKNVTTVDAVVKED